MIPLVPFQALVKKNSCSLDKLAPLVLFKILVKNHHFFIDQIIVDIFIYTYICEEQFKEDYNGYIIKNITLSGSCEKFRNVILFADYIKFGPQTFDCYIYFVLNICFSISSLRI